MNAFDGGSSPAQLRLGRSTRPLWVVTAAAVWLLASAGCAARTGPSHELRDARIALAQARSAPGSRAAAPELREAEAALAYAEFEERETPGHPLASRRARAALELAQRARRASLAAPVPAPVAGGAPQPVSVGAVPGLGGGMARPGTNAASGSSAGIR